MYNWSLVHVHNNSSLFIYTYVSRLYSDEGDSSRVGPSALSVLVRNSPGSAHSSGPGAQAEWVDCIQASEMCNQNPNCSSRYRVMRQCLVGKEKDAMLDNNRECQAALEVLLLSPLYDCRCKRGMKKELQCLQNYWTIHMGLGEGKTWMIFIISCLKNSQRTFEFHILNTSSLKSHKCNSLRSVISKSSFQSETVISRKIVILCGELKSMSHFQENLQSKGQGTLQTPRGWAPHPMLVP